MEKKNNNLTLILTVLICLLPMILGAVLYSKLPEQMPIHFNIKNEPDNYANKSFALFGMPIIMATIQAICMIVTSIKIKKIDNNYKPTIIKIMEWFIPILTIFIYIIMIEVPLGSTVYVGKSVCLILGILFIIIGNYTPKMSYELGKSMVHPHPKDEKSFRKMLKIMGYSFIIVGVILLLLIIWA